MMAEAKLHSPICSTFEVLVCNVWLLSWKIFGPLLLTIAGCRHCSFQCISPICWACFLDVMVSLGFRNLYWIRGAADHQTFTMTLFLVQVWLWEVLLSFLFIQPQSRLSLVLENPFFCHVSQSNKEMVHCFLE